MENMNDVRENHREPIDTRENYEPEQWPGEFRMSRDELKRAVEESGATSDDVEEYLSRERALDYWSYF